jgi:spermidine synthase
LNPLLRYVLVVLVFGTCVPASANTTRSDHNPDQFHYRWQEQSGTVHVKDTTRKHNSLKVQGGQQANASINANAANALPTDLDTQLLVAHAPLFLAPEARSILIIGHGSGITAGSVMRHPIEHADLV